MIAYLESKQIEIVSDFGKTWTFVGVRATATIRISEDDHPTGYVTRFTIQTAGVWGVEQSFEDDEYVVASEYENDEMFELNEMLKALNVQTNTISNERAYELASAWHGGQSSALYSLASTHTVHGQAHKTKLINEIKQDIRIEGATENLAELGELLSWVNVQ